MPTATTWHARTVFPATFYVDVMTEMRAAARESLIAKMPERRANGTAMVNSLLQPGEPRREPDEVAYMLSVPAVEAAVATMFSFRAPGLPVGHVTTAGTMWSFDTFDELLTALRQPHSLAMFELADMHSVVKIDVYEDAGNTKITISSSDRAVVQRFVNYFADAAPTYETALPEPVVERPHIFIGHGRSAQWLELSNYLHHQMKYDVEAFETLPRAGHTIKEVLDKALVANNVAILVMTAEDEQADGEHSMRARQNVVHETGLFQGRLGFHRTIVLLEDGTDDYSNLAGLQELRYPAGSIKTTYGDVIATLQREFPG